MFRIARRVLGARKRANNAPPQSKNVPQAVPEQPTQPSTGFSNPFANMNSGQGTTNPFLLIAGSFVGVYLAFSLMNVVFGHRRVNANHVDQYGRPVDPRTGRPLAQWHCDANFWSSLKLSRSHRIPSISFLLSSGLFVRVRLPRELSSQWSFSSWYKYRLFVCVL